MEKLILRSIMYGADKIPDSWFEKVPGGFYRHKDGQPPNGKGGSPNSSRPSTSNGGGGSGSGRSRRRSTGEQMRDEYDEDGYRSDARRRRRDRDREDEARGSTYDGIDDDYYSGDDRHRRRNHGSARRRRSFEGNHNGFEYGTGMPPRDEPYEQRGNGRAPYPQGDFGPQVRVQPPNQYPPPVGATAAGAAAGAAAMGAAPYPPSDVSPRTMSPNHATPTSRSPNPVSPPPSRPSTSGPSGIASGYVPYANIYGAPNPVDNRAPFSPPPQSQSGTTTGSVQPNDMNRVAPVAPQFYSQNPYAQDGGATAGAGAAYAGYDQRQPEYDPGYYDLRHEHRYDDRYNGYDETGRPVPLSISPPRHRRQSRPDDSLSYDSYDSRDDALRRARPERRPDKDDKRAKSKGRGKSSIREKFDTSQRGLGYGAVGAVAGGLVGSELGKGPVATAIGVAVGALGANAFEARERYVPQGYPPQPPLHITPMSPSGMQHPPTHDPRQPLGPHFGGHQYAGGRQLRYQDAPRRRECERHAQSTEDGTYARRDAKRRSSGYHSD